ncbi:MAG TPA: hypothetical protein VF610_06510, partial [Segetibacter sp.]
MKHLSLNLSPLFVLIILICSCQNSRETKSAPSTEGDVVTKASPEVADSKVNKTMASAATILARKEVPVLCYHQIRDWTGSDSKSARDYIIPVETFRSHLKMLADSGYHTVLPDQVYD